MFTLVVLVMVLEIGTWRLGGEPGRTGIMLLDKIKIRSRLDHTVEDVRTATEVHAPAATLVSLERRQVSSISGEE